MPILVGVQTIFGIAISMPGVLFRSLHEVRGSQQLARTPADAFRGRNTLLSIVSALLPDA
jgi:hypothetical protein